MRPCTSSQAARAFARTFRMPSRPGSRLRSTKQLNGAREPAVPIAIPPTKRNSQTALDTKRMHRRERILCARIRNSFKRPASRMAIRCGYPKSGDPVPFPKVPPAARRQGMGVVCRTEDTRFKRTVGVTSCPLGPTFGFQGRRDPYHRECSSRQ
jgi:hypothetical protein